MAILIFIVILAGLIIVHEYGHFFVAKKSGVRVDEFGLGYPPRAKTLWKKKGTEFTLNWLPFGGFVKIYGEDMSALSGEGPKDALVSKPKWVQALVLFAGPFMNFLSAWVLILFMLFFGLPTGIDSSMNQKFIHDQKIIVTDVTTDSPAKNSGLLTEDVIKTVSIKGTSYEVSDTDDLHELVVAHPKDEFTFEVTRGGEAETVRIKPEFVSETNSYMLGIGISKFGIYKPPFGRAILDSFVFTWSAIKSITIGLVNIIGGFFTPGDSLQNVAGPVGIVSLVGKASHEGVMQLLTFIALISINLGVINLIPFPALDGGRLLFLGIEKVIGRTVNPKITNMLNTAGFLLLIAFMLFITYKDILKII